MLLVYWICCLVGSLFVVLAAVGGLDGADFDSEFEIDVGVDRRDEEERSPLHRRRGLWLPIFSLRFWTFGVCFFGLSGILLSATEMTAATVLLTSVAMGVICGSIVAIALRQLGRRRIDSLVRSTDYVGLSGTVEIPFDANSRGKIQLQIRGTTLGVMALTDDPNGFQVGDTVFIVSMSKNRVWVVSQQDAIGQLPDAAPPDCL
ncbi:MAG: NfeD-like protein [Leptolyngbya sp. DLM2.Bin15]|nr:MAG: NfeD-like protein [Leptolyngbya sp. DLM2.Bin15]